MLLVLEDNLERVARFERALKAVDAEMAIKVWGTAWEMIEALPALLEGAAALSLDHDLEPRRGEKRDPGDGLEVVRFLVGQPIVRPVVVHSSNLERARMMADELEAAGWGCKRVRPIGEDWIETDWVRTMRNVMGKTR